MAATLQSVVQAVAGIEVSSDHIRIAPSYDLPPRSLYYVQHSDLTDFNHPGRRYKRLAFSTVFFGSQSHLKTMKLSSLEKTSKVL
jgi:hypothetical protein